MRRIALFLSAALAYAGTASACLTPRNQEALDVIGLKSTLMVSALTCGQRNEYDRFMTRFQPYILREQHVMDAYFREHHGRAFHHYEDSYVTNLANVQSTAGIRQGTAFCAASAQLFGRVLATPDQAALTTFARQHPATQPGVVLACGIVETSGFRRIERFAPAP
ncbi:unnamed protein product [Acidocella sp. C78]|uniref:hypothetical protein n=1 Tax=Acidocella sp. C78 TaxID=1671486 RepID=UPI00191B9725|nr:hypothetical protein [Acidocella sp. C78]CAG4915444.1 unnamed protein product [Acidocella sp. C78]